MKKLILTAVTFFLLVHLAWSQKSPEKFGKNIMEHLQATTCPIDASAGAYVIFDYGSIDYMYIENKGFYWYLNRHLRIKILDKNEFDEAEFAISLYDYTERENISGFKAVSYNLENGKIVESKIGNKDAIREESSEHWDRFKFALPNVKEGTVIEVEYRLTSPFPYYLRDWDFQKDIPVLHSEIWIRIPEYYEYNQNMKGYYSLTTAESNYEFGSLSIRGESLQYKVESKHYLANNLPALKAEDYVDNIENYRSSIQFELIRLNFFMDITEFTTSWDAVINRLMESFAFGQKIGRAGYAKEKVDELKTLYTDEEQLAAAIFSYVQNNLKWNGSTGFSSDQSLRQVYNDGTGRAADINFILLNMLTDAGINAIPVALSTRANGIILPTFPTMDEFNYMVVLAIVNGKNILLDASDAHCPPGILPVRCLNGKGRIIHKGYNSWVDLNPGSNFSETIMYDLAMDESGNFNGKLNAYRKGYASIQFRHRMDQALSTDKMIEDIEEANPGMDIISNEYKGLEESYGAVQEDYEVEITSRSEFMGDLISFNPLMYERHEVNPFKLEKREYPVNYAYPRDYKYIFKYKIPEGYIIESIPEPLIMSMPESHAKYTYSASQMGDILTLTVLLQINKDIFIPTEYDLLKEFYNQIVAKEAEQVILKKLARP